MSGCVTVTLLSWQLDLLPTGTALQSDPSSDRDSIATGSLLPWQLNQLLLATRGLDGLEDMRRYVLLSEDRREKGGGGEEGEEEGE